MSGDRFVQLLCYGLVASLSPGPLLAGCDNRDLVSPLDDVGVVEDDTGVDVETDVADGSGLSECTLVPQSGCSRGEACVPASSGLRLCILAGDGSEGAPCDARFASSSCVAGMICADTDEESARCRVLCDPLDDACEAGVCQEIALSDGEAFGVCL